MQRTHRIAVTALLVAAAGMLAAGCTPTPPPPKACNVAVVGDSLSVHAAPHLPAALHARGCTLAWSDTKGGRKTGEGLAILEARNTAGQLPYVLIVGLGTNDRYELAEFPGRVDRVIALANGRQVIWIDTSHLPIRDNINAVLADRARRHPNFTVIGWNEPFWATPSWRQSDNIHATAAGSAARADMMAAEAQRVTK